MAKKRLDTADLANELAGGSAFFAKKTAPVAPQPTPLPEPKPIVEEKPIPVPEPISAPTVEEKGSNKEENVPINQSIDQSINQPTNQPINSGIDNSQIMGKPRGFYISEQQNDDLDTAVEKLAAKLRDKTAQKIDRSTVLRLLIEKSNLTDDQTINSLAEQFIKRLISQLSN